LEKEQEETGKSAGLIIFDGFSNNFSFSVSRFADTFFGSHSEGIEW